MRHIYIIIVICISFFSCKPKKTIEINQITSKEIVTIENNYMDKNKIKDSFRISIPTEYEIRINSFVHYITWFYKVNNKTLNPSRIDYQVYDKRDLTKEILELNFDKSFNNESIGIIVKERNHLISKKDAQQLLKKYSINKSLDSLKSNDTIKLVSYDKFRKENKMFIQELNKISDSIHFTAMKKDGSFFYVSKKINW
ncbi:hypothetical protein HYN56_21085 [Flavobacterium crocinum]|uniref:Uncharacterized protein n=1 Tax=Flavobacterium crocinum TaxID=2183896 RepID=A0A2S1YR66_9FLAO|nr:hypothetical protein [Flavobacterium crocinum]AWK06587.1 hypothetical protein HYN56_21085 [Flavobacterium crocinum]